MTSRNPTARTKDRAMIVFSPAVGILMESLCCESEKLGVLRLGRRRPEPRRRRGFSYSSTSMASVQLMKLKGSKICLFAVLMAVARQLARGVLGCVFETGALRVDVVSSSWSELGRFEE